MPMSAMGARNVVVPAQRFANSHRHCFFSDIKVRQPRHQRSRIELIHLLFEFPDHNHPPVHPHPMLGFRFRFGFGLIRCHRHGFTPDICARTSNSTAKSFSTNPIPRAAVRNSFVIAVVGIATSRSPPTSPPSFMSFCVLFTV